MRFDDRSLAPYSGNEPFIFLSYSHKDKNEAEEIIRKLNENDYRVWYDEGITAGKEWTANIAERIEQCGYFFALLSENYYKSTQCRKELLYAIQKARSVLPVYLENIELPSDLAFQLIAIRAVYKEKDSPNEGSFYNRIFSADGLDICKTPKKDIEKEYLSACELLNEAKNSKKLNGFIQAKQAFQKIVNYKDSRYKIKECENRIAAIKKRKAIILVSVALVCFVGLFIAYNNVSKNDAKLKEEYEGSQSSESVIVVKSEDIVSDPVPVNQNEGEATTIVEAVPVNETVQQEIMQVSAGGRHTVALQADGSLTFTGDNEEGQLNVNEWNRIRKVSAGVLNTVALVDDGTVLATGNNQFGQCNLNDWKAIIDIDTEHYHTVGLQSDGRVIAAGFKDRGACDVVNWENIIMVAAGEYHSLGLSKDGHVIAAGDNRFHQCETSNWEGIVSIDAGYNHTVGLKDDGSVLATGKNDRGQCNVSEWKSIVQISAGGEHTVALCEDGTVLAVGNNDHGQCNVSEWSDIVSVSAGYYHTVGVKSDGTIVATGWNKYGQCNTGKLVEG